MITLSTFEILHMFEDIKSEYDQLGDEVRLLQTANGQIDEKTRSIKNMADEIADIYNVKYD
jgi:hypothetical protein